MPSCLVIDDMPTERALLKKIVETCGYSVRAAASGEEGLAACDQEMPDVILLDWSMQGMDGMDFLRTLRAREDGEKSYVIMCTGHDHPSHVGHSYVHGANDFIIKPVTVDKLKEKFAKMRQQHVA